MGRLTLRDVHSRAIQQELADGVARLEAAGTSSGELDQFIRSRLNLARDENRLHGRLSGGLRVLYKGTRLPKSGEPFDAGDPSTSTPGDDYPELLGALFHEYTAAGDGVFGLFARSRVFEREAGRQDLKPRVWDPYGHNLQSSATLAELEGHPYSFGYLHLPAPGIVDRPRLSAHRFNSEVVLNGVEWELLEEDAFLEQLHGLLDLTVSQLRPRRLAVLSRRGRWGTHRSVPLLGLVAQMMERLGCTRVRQNDVFFSVGKVPTELKAELSHAHLQVFDVTP